MNMKMLNFAVAYNQKKVGPTFLHLLKQLLLVLSINFLYLLYLSFTLLACNVCIAHIYAHVLVFNNLCSLKEGIRII